MMRTMRMFLFNLLLVLTCVSIDGYTQGGNIQHLKTKLHHLQQNKQYLSDTAYINTVNNIAFLYADRYPDSAFYILNGLPEQSRRIGFRRGETDAYKVLGNASQTKGNFELALRYYDSAYALAQKIHYRDALPGLLGNIALVYLNQGNYAVALQKFYASMSAAEAVNDKLVIRSSLNNIGTIHFYQGKMAEAEKAYQKTLDISRAIADTPGMITALNNLGEVNLEQNETAKALNNLSIAYGLTSRKNVPDMLVAVTNTLGDTYLRIDSLPKAAAFFETALGLARRLSNARATCKALIGLAKVQLKQGMLQPALAHAQEALAKATAMGQTQLLRDANETVADIYEKSGQGNLALIYYKQYKLYADSLVSIESERAAANYKAEYEFSKKELEFQRKALQQRWLIFSALAALFSLLIILLIISRSRKRLSLTYKDLQHKNLIIEGQKKKAEETLAQLKAAQAQLIQAEKMASLGELTAGIAHEIQNPLNFVKNFSEVSNELLDEMMLEVQKGNNENVKDIAADVQQNLEKIIHHGKRADAIVKGMLQHSRSSTGQKEATDLNRLADEYWRLAYHGLRAKDKTFNATLQTDFDAGLQPVAVIPQDVGRVILNLITNALYAVDEKKQQGIPGYEPTVRISTRQLKHHIEIVVADNGNGIPQTVKEKIFQPFFTTKPTGQGTGLGLSLAYDIIKAHGGKITCDTKEGEGTIFTIQL